MSKVALIFPGQGAQEVGMGLEFYETSPQAKAVFDQADKIIPGLVEVTFRGPAEKLTSTKYCQPAIFTFSVAALEALKVHPKFKNVLPSFACGLSLGELSAVYACGALGFDSVLKLVERRSFFMDEACRMAKGSMAAVIGFDKEKLLKICEQAGAEIANYNSPEQIVITGSADNVRAACRAIEEAGAKRVILLDVAGAFHSNLMMPAVPKFEAELGQASFMQPKFPILSNVNALPEMNPDVIRQNLAKQIRSSVRWEETVSAIAEAGVTVFLEIGPGTVLKGLIRKISRDLVVYNIQKPDDIEKLPF